MSDTTKRIIFTNDEGGVSVVVPAPNTGLSIEEVAMKSVPKGKDFEIVDVEEVPSDRTFRNAWEKDGNKVVHNLAKAKGIAHDKRRAKRAAEFAPLDVEATIPAKASQAEVARQAIRDKYAVMQNNIDAAQDIDTLKGIVASL